MRTIKIGYTEFNWDMVEGKTREELARDFEGMRPEVLDELHRQVGSKEPKKEKATIPEELTEAERQDKKSKSK